EATVGFVDYITLSTSLLFSMKYATSLEDMRKQTMYNRIKRSDYCAEGYLDGLVLESCDYRVLFEKYKDRDDVAFLVDPPYLSTDVSTYNMNWKLSDYLDVLSVLVGHKYVYFTSNKSSIIELCDWLGRNQNIGNPFASATRNEFNASMNYNSRYTDIMLYNIA
ncbi:MAG: DNA adenine methylase, partial [Duncaniella sp.]|nr:DNA adenine methylase [Duncaniella sp.]